MISRTSIALKELRQNKPKKLMKTRKGYQFAVRDFKNWPVKDINDQINLMAGNQARIALTAIAEGKLLKSAICLAYSYPPELS